MKTSIVIPVLNDDFIYKCLNFILENFNKKIPKNKQIIVINDQKSNEIFSQKLKAFCKDNKIDYHKSEKPGASFNRNKGIELAKGEKIIFIDSDCFPSKKWLNEMEESLKDFDIVEGKVSYAAKENPLFDRFVENKSTPNRFLTANLGIRKVVGQKCKFDDRFIVFREDTDFGFCALEKGFTSSFNQKAEVFHKQSRFTIKKFVLERKRYIGEPLLFKKHKLNPLLKNHVPRIWKFSHPIELILLFFLVTSIFMSWKLLILAYLLPGIIYCSNKYFISKRTFKIKDTLLVLLFLPITMIVKRIYIWKGSIRFKVLLL